MTQRECTTLRERTSEEMERRPLIEYVVDNACGRYYPNEDELRAIGDFTRENVRRWMDSHTGPDWVNMVSVVDLHAVCGDMDIPWATEEGQKIWTKVMKQEMCENCKQAPAREGSAYCIMCEDKMYGFRY